MACFILNRWVDKQTVQLCYKLLRAGLVSFDLSEFPVLVAWMDEKTYPEFYCSQQFHVIQGSIQDLGLPDKFLKNFTSGLKAGSHCKVDFFGLWMIKPVRKKGGKGIKELVLILFQLIFRFRNLSVAIWEHGVGLLFLRDQAAESVATFVLVKVNWFIITPLTLVASTACLSRF